MNFFAQQDRARSNTRQLLLLLGLTVICLAAITSLLIATAIYCNSDKYSELSLWQGIAHTLSLRMFIAIGLGVCCIIFLGSVYNYLQFSSGGRAVAEALGGRLLNLDSATADERKILNVVEEMAIASGTPVPPVYLLDDAAINAFAAGHTPQDAVIGITRGCIQLLSRDELQGVIAHEFSHIFHGDMKLNMQLLALLNGILLLGQSGEFLMRNSNSRSDFNSGKDRSSSALAILGLGLIVIGYSGTFFGRLIKAAVSRQREFLADASAVKFTRNPEGIAGALKKIGGYAYGSQLQHAQAAEFSHMYFSQGLSDHLLQLMATHPPLAQRIKCIEPHWDGEFPQIEKPFSATTLDTETAAFASPNYAPIEFTVNLDQVLETIAQPAAAHLAAARQTIDAIAGAVQDYTRNAWDAQALMLGLLLDNSIPGQERQWQLLETIFSAAEIAALKKPALSASSVAARLRLPLLELSLPALKQLSAQQYQCFKQALNIMIRADDQVTLLEWAFYRILIHNLEQRPAVQQQLDLELLSSEASILLSAVAHAGGANTAEVREAFAHSKTIIGLDAVQLLAPGDFQVKDLNRAVSRLNHIKPLQKPRLLKALGECILKDGKINSDEAELFRAIADALDCPIPPFLSQADTF